MLGVTTDKQPFRERVWSLMDSERGIGLPPGARGRIPNFVGAEVAAERLAQSVEWQSARVIKVNPDTPQLAVRERALEAGKVLIVPVPKLSAEVPFFMLEQSLLNVPAREAASIEGAARHGVPTAFEELPAIDLIVCGSVAVDARGARIGKGGGYADLEFALLLEIGQVGEWTSIATTIHDVQLFDEALPETAHDYRVDLIATPTRILRSAQRARPSGIVWEHLDDAKITSIPALALRRDRRLHGP
jgi:5-formyltetrahydrofolate cyclo-ligase